MNNYEKIQQMNLDEVAAQLTAFVIFMMNKVAEKMNLFSGAKELFSEEDTLDICNIFTEWLKQEE